MRVIKVMQKVCNGERKLRCAHFDPERLRRAERAMLAVAEAIQREQPVEDPGDNPFPAPFSREQTVALGALFLLGMRAHVGFDVIGRADELCEEVVAALERETGVDW